MTSRSARLGGVTYNPNAARPQCKIFGCELLGSSACCFYCDHRASCPDPCNNHPDRCNCCVFPTKWQEKVVNVFVSQPMKDVDPELIRHYVSCAKRFAEDKTHKRVHILETYNPAYKKTHPITALSHALSMLSKADLCIFMPGWEEARGCIIEHETAVSYGIPVAYYEEEKGEQK